MRPLRMSDHAVDRWLERVDRGEDRASARRALRRFLAGGRRRPTPRRWTRPLQCRGRLTFVYNARRPNVCALVVDGTVVTVLTRELCLRRTRRYETTR